jgi:hypothetical protein
MVVLSPANGYANLELGIRKAEKLGKHSSVVMYRLSPPQSLPGIAAIIEPQDFLSDNPDEVGIITYVMQIYFKIVSLQVPLVAEKTKKKKAA